MAKKKQTEYHGGKIRHLVETVARMVANDTSLAENTGLLHSMLRSSFDGYGKRESCYNCKRSMKITAYEADLHDALLILAMAKEVRNNLNKGMNFTEANKVHLPTLNASNATIKRNTKCDYLGLVKQPDNWRGTGYWLLTRWAWAALRGEEISAKAKYWEGNLVSRSEEKTTLKKMFGKHRELVEASIAKRKAVKADYRAVFEDYKPADWSLSEGCIQDSN